MDEKIYKITLADGTVINNLTMNGNNFISNEAIKASIFEANCCPVTINDGTSEEVHENMELVQITSVEGKSWFVLRDLTEREITTAKMQSDIEYVAMMSGINLD